MGRYLERLQEIAIRLVLASAMRRLLFILVGAFAIGALAYGAIDLFGRWYGSRYIKSDSDINDIFVVFLGILAVGIIGGGVLGNWFHHYHLSKQSTRPAK
jgi:hypothetical protein